MNVRPFLSLTMLLAIGSVGHYFGCSSISGTKPGSGNDVDASGPTVLNPRTQPGAIELDHNLQAKTPADVLADVKDFSSNITEVHLRFLHVPIEVPMTNIGGTTWKATLSARELQLLAVAGRTMTYDANIVAKDDAGKTAVSKSPVQIAVKTPDQVNGAG